MQRRFQPKQQAARPSFAPTAPQLAPVFSQPPAPVFPQLSRAHTYVPSEPVLIKPTLHIYAPPSLEVDTEDTSWDPMDLD